MLLRMLASVSVLLIARLSVHADGVTNTATLEEAVSDVIASRSAATAEAALRLCDALPRAVRPVESAASSQSAVTPPSQQAAVKPLLQRLDVLQLAQAARVEPAVWPLLSCLVESGAFDLHVSADPLASATIALQQQSGESLGHELLLLAAELKQLKLAVQLLTAGVALHSAAATSRNQSRRGGSNSIKHDVAPAFPLLHTALSSDLLVLENLRQLLAERGSGSSESVGLGARSLVSPQASAQVAGTKMGSVLAAPNQAAKRPQPHLQGLFDLARRMLRHLDNGTATAAITALHDLVSPGTPVANNASLTRITQQAVGAPAGRSPSLAQVRRYVARADAASSEDSMPAEAVGSRPTWLHSEALSIRAQPLRTLANALCQLLVRVVTDTAQSRLQAALSRLAALTGLPSSSNGGSSAAGSADRRWSVRQALVQVADSWRVLVARDRYGRTALHVAAMVGAADAAADILQVVFNTANMTSAAADALLAVEPAAGSPAGAPPVPPAVQRLRIRRASELAGAAAVQALLAAEDSLGATALAVAQRDGAAPVAAVLAAAVVRMRQLQSRHGVVTADATPLPGLAATADTVGAGAAVWSDGCLAEANTHSWSRPPQPAGSQSDAASGGWGLNDGELISAAGSSVQRALAIARQHAATQECHPDVDVVEISPAGDMPDDSEGGVPPSASGPVIDAAGIGPDGELTQGTVPAAAQTAVHSACTRRGTVRVTPQHFLLHYVVGRRPALLRGYAAAWPLREALSRHQLLSVYGNMSFPVAAVPYARAFGGIVSRATLADYAAKALRCSADGLLPPQFESAQHLSQAPSSSNPTEPGYIFDAPGSATAASTTHAATALGADAADRLNAQSDADPSLPRWMSDPLAAQLLQHMNPVPPFLQGAVPRFPAADALAADLANLTRAAASGKVRAPVALTGVLQACITALQASTQHTASRMAIGAGAASLRDPLVLVPAGSAFGPAHNGTAIGSAAATTDLAGRPGRPPKPQFYLGPPGSGAPMHLHKDAWNVLAHGQKRWYLLRPQDALYSTQPVAAWVRDAFDSPDTSNATASCDEASNPTRQPCAGGRSSSPRRSDTSIDGAERTAAPDWLPQVMQCTQRAGDVMYVPAGWGHAVLNTATSVGLAVEFSATLRLPF